MEHDIEKRLSYAKQSLTLSDAEKGFHRAKLAEFMRDRSASIPSPFHPFAFAGVRYALAGLFLLVASGSGIALAAESALPANPLYLVKVKVTEPARLALTLDAEDKAALEVDLVDRRLKEFAQASIDGDLDSDALALVTDSLADNIDAAQSSVTALGSAEDSNAAFETAVDLQSTLAAHADILKKVQAAQPGSAPEIDAVADALADATTETDALVGAAEDTVEASAPDAIDSSADAQATETIAAFAQVKEAIAREDASYDDADRESLEASLRAIGYATDAAKAKDEAGDPKAAYLLYVRADQMISALKTAVEADQDLGIDVIDEIPDPESAQ
jgi:hypothetical protein